MDIWVVSTFLASWITPLWTFVYTFLCGHMCSLLYLVVELLSRMTSWVFIGRTDAEAETPVLWPPHAKSSHWKRPWCWEGLGAGGKGDDRGWNGWMASLTWWLWVWVNSGSWWWTGRPGVLQFIALQRVGHDWATELNWGHPWILTVPVPKGQHRLSPNWDHSMAFSSEKHTFQIFWVK